MAKILLFCLCLIFPVLAQEGNLDPSIFDGTGKALEKVEPEKPSAGTPESPPESAQSPEQAVNPSEEAQESTPAAAESAAEPKSPGEIVLPGTENEEPKSPPGEDPGIPAAQGENKSRAGETVNSTEKIAPGQAVDFPWDM